MTLILQTMDTLCLLQKQKMLAYWYWQRNSENRPTTRTLGTSLANGIGMHLPYNNCVGGYVDK